MALLKVTIDAKLAIDIKEISVMILICFSEAVDMLDRQRLLFKPQFLNMSDTTIEWYKSYPKCQFSIQFRPRPQ